MQYMSYHMYIQYIAYKALHGGFGLNTIVLHAIVRNNYTYRLDSWYGKGMVHHTWI